jgi:uncharacterized protein YcgI (DUF1989 family)
MTHEEIHIPAGHGKAFTVRTGQCFELVDVEGQQVGDLTALASADRDEHVFLPVTRLALGRLQFVRGDSLLTNHRRPILRLENDIAGADILFGVCDRYRYEIDFGMRDYHRSCRDNFVEALAEFGVSERQAGIASDNGVNIFINQRLDEHGAFHLDPPRTKPGDAAVFTACLDAIVAISACPEDGSPCNGGNPTPMMVRLL